MYPGIFIIVIYILMALLCLLFVIILCYVVYKHKIETNTKKWEKCIQNLIGEALFNQQIHEPTNESVEKLINNKKFRNCLIGEIVQTRKTLAGDAGLSLCKLYESLELDKDSFAKLTSFRWHIKAIGIQELSTMGQTKYVKSIFRLTNHTNEFVRNEAQCALVNFYGFPGLRFLNVINHPLSQWQQIQLLNRMNGQIPEDLSVMKKWLRSESESLVIFSLKLATHYNCFDLQADVMNCLPMSYRVRIYVMEFMKKMPTDDAGKILLSDFKDQSDECRLLTLKTLRDVGNESHVSLLISFLESANEYLISEILETLLVLNPLGALQSSIYVQKFPAAQLVKLKNEHAA